MEDNMKCFRTTHSYKTAFATFVLVIFAVCSLYADDPQSHIIEFGNYFYDPDHLDVAVGDTIVWQGNFAAHPLHSKSVPDGAEHWGPIASGTEFSYVVEVEGTYEYGCTLHDQTFDMNGSFVATLTSVNGGNGDLPEVFRLRQNYPNPFNPSTEIRFELHEQMHVTLEIFTVTGQRVGALADGPHEAGHHTVTFDATGLPSGVYIYRLQSDREVQTRRMIYIQ